MTVEARREALVVIKVGGEVVESAHLRPLARDVARLAQSGRAVVVVHGGGPQATKLQARLGIPTVQIAGRRVTDVETLEVMKMVVAGKLNVELCAALVAEGARPVGLHGASALAVEAERRPPRVYSGAGPDPVDLGFVGDVVGVASDLFARLLEAGFVPVVACLGADRDGNVYNINADVVATRVAVELGAQGRFGAPELFLVSDVPGVLRDVADPSSRMSRLTAAEAKQLIAEGAITRGMIPKLEESFATLAQGVSAVHIVGKLGEGDLFRAATEPGAVGTALVP